MLHIARTLITIQQLIYQTRREQRRTISSIRLDALDVVSIGLDTLLPTADNRYRTVQYEPETLYRISSPELQAGCCPWAGLARAAPWGPEEEPLSTLDGRGI
jgi:hypothetical protein